MDEADSERRKRLQQAFLLGQLADCAPQTQAELNKKTTSAAKRELALDNDSAKRLREELVAMGHLEARKERKTQRLSLTEQGRAYLGTLEQPELPKGRARAAAKSVKPPKQTPVPGDEATISDELREGQKAFLLLQLLNAEGHALTMGEANKFKELDKGNRGSLGFSKAAVANFRRERLAELGYVKITQGRPVIYTLLPDGIEYLAACTQHLSRLNVTVRGSTLNALIVAAREPSLQQTPVPPSAPKPEIPAPAQLAEAVLAEFQELYRERYGHIGLVPIHEVRARIAARFGEDAARHDVLDEAILGLWREKRIGLEGISDLGRATKQELNDSIDNDGDTLFYLEVPRAQPINA